MTTHAARRLEVEVNQPFRIEVRVHYVVGELIISTDAFRRDGERFWTLEGHRDSDSDEHDLPLHVYTLMPLEKGKHNFEYFGPESKTGEYGADYRKLYEVIVK